MRKILFYTTIAIVVFLLIAMFTPVGTWILFAIIGTGSTYIIVIIVAALALMLIATFPKKESEKIQRKWLGLAVIVITTVILLSTANFGGSFYGEWVLARDARVGGFRIADSPNVRFYFSNDGTLLRTDPHNDTVEESNWQIVESGTRNVMIIGWTAYEYRFSHFGRRLILEQTGAERPRIPHMTPQRDLEITLRR